MAVCENGCGTELTGRQRRWCSDPCAKAGARRARLDSVFAITPEEYDAILEYQGGRCAICRRLPKPGKRFAVDHSHVTGWVRGLLCYPCNKRLVGARSDHIIAATAEYIADPPARHVIGDRVAPGRPPARRRKRRPKRSRTPVG